MTFVMSSLGEQHVFHMEKKSGSVLLLTERCVVYKALDGLHRKKKDKELCLHTLT